MNYRIIALATLGVGNVLTLTAAQAYDRRHAVKALGDDRFEVLAPVQFKVGEVIGLEGDLPKAMAEQLEDAAKEPVAPAKPVKATTRRK